MQKATDSKRDSDAHWDASMPDQNLWTFDELISSGKIYLSDGYRTKAAELGKPGVPILRVAEVLNGKIAPGYGDHVREEYRSFFAKKVSKPGDIVVTTKGTVGRVAKIPAKSSEFVYSPQVCFVRVIDDALIDQAWLYYWFQSGDFRIQAMRVKGQTDMADYINLVDLRGMKLTIPNLPHQQDVSSALSAFDDKIRANERVGDDCRRLAIALFDPARWPRLVELGELCALGKTPVSPATLGNATVSHFSIPAFDKDATPNSCTAESILSNKFAIEGNAVLLSKLNPRIPRAWHVRKEGTDVALASTEFLVLYPQDGINSEELWAACSQAILRNELTLRVTGTSGSHQRVRPDDVLSVPTIDPRHVDDRTRDQVVDLVRRADLARMESRVLNELRDTLLPRLMSGEMRVKKNDRVAGDVS